MAKATNKPTAASGAAAKGDIVEVTEMRVTLEQLCDSCGVNETWITELVAHGVIMPSPQPEQSHFAATSVMRVRKAKRLVQDFRLNTPGVALALDLLDEIDRLQKRVAAFERPRHRHDDD